MKKYQEGVEPTAEEMREFCKRYNSEEWGKLVENNIFVQNYGSDLNLVAVAAEMILDNKPVTTVKDVRKFIKKD